MSNQSRIPSNRFNRMFRLGKLASGIAGSALQQGAKKVIRGERPVASDMLLTPANANRISSQLSEMRGAVMKIGQLLSMEAGDILPKELTDILGNLRDSAHSMPLPATRLCAAFCSGQSLSNANFHERIASNEFTTVHTVQDSI